MEQNPYESPHANLDHPQQQIPQLPGRSSRAAGTVLFVMAAVIWAILAVSLRQGTLLINAAVAAPILTIAGFWCLVKPPAR